MPWLISNWVPPEFNPQKRRWGNFSVSLKKKEVDK
jgi:hypothetical protein